jgi:hypothetical protein
MNRRRFDSVILFQNNASADWSSARSSKPGYEGSNPSRGTKNIFTFLEKSVDTEIIRTYNNIHAVKHNSEIVL